MNDFLNALSNGVQAIGGVTRDLFANLPQGEGPMAGYQPQQDDPFKGVQYGDALDAFGKMGGNDDPFAGLQYAPLGRDDLMGGYQSSRGGMFDTDPAGAFTSSSQFLGLDRAIGRAEQRRFADEDADRRLKAAQDSATGKAPGSRDYSGAATADDNAGITAAQIDGFVASKFKESPLVGSGAAILAIANKYGVSVPVLLGIAWKESGMGTNVGVGNIFGLTDPTTDGGLGGQRAFQKYGNPLEEVEAAARNLATPTFRGKSAAEQIGAWYVGPEEYGRLGLNATDKAGNGTVGEYLDNFIAPAYAAFGKPLNPNQAATQRAGGTVSANGAAFPVVGYQGKIDLHHGSEKGGADIFAPTGTAVVAMRGGRVTDAGWSEIGGWNVTIVGEDGLTYYYAHLYQQPLVRAGQQLATGTQLGGVGDTGNAKGTGAHLHLGIGYGINTGTGPQGGSGMNFDANEYLNSTLQGGR